MSAQTAMQPAKAPIPVKQFVSYDVFDQIQKTLKETQEESKKRKTVYPNETM